MDQRRRGLSCSMGWRWGCGEELLKQCITAVRRGGSIVSLVALLFALLALCRGTVPNIERYIDLFAKSARIHFCDISSRFVCDLFAGRSGMKSTGSGWKAFKMPGWSCCSTTVSHERQRDSTLKLWLGWLRRALPVAVSRDVFLSAPSESVGRGLAGFEFIVEEDAGSASDLEEAIRIFIDILVRMCAANGGILFPDKA